MDSILNYFLTEAVEAKIPKLYHISFRSGLAGQWQPRAPDGLQNTDSKDALFPEPKNPRISCSPTLEECFYAIYPNISFFFEEKHFPYMDFSVYSPVLTGTERIWTPEYLTRHHLVHDAHVTSEYSILEAVEMKYVGKLRVFNPLKNAKPTEIKYYPFDDKKFGERFLAYKMKIDFKPV